MWDRAHLPELYEHTYKFLPWSGFIAFMLGADPVSDYSQANRTCSLTSIAATGQSLC